jgi:hypothetical protein
MSIRGGKGGEGGGRKGKGCVITLDFQLILWSPFRNNFTLQNNEIFEDLILGDEDYNGNIGEFN